MRILITGAAGFIGSHLVDDALHAGHDVVGIDSYTTYYDRSLKERNQDLLRRQWGFECREMEVAALTSRDLQGVDCVIHLAAQPGVRLSWAEFDTYLSQNLSATQHLASVCAEAGSPKLVFASSSSIYGDAADYPTSESTILAPRSPYGVTKAAGEMLLEAHAQNFGIAVIALRFFTVYGPGQRPDMAIQRLIRASLDGSEFTLLGSGGQQRDFTYISDVTRACLLAVELAEAHGFTSMNVGGSGTIDINSLIELVAGATNRPISVDRKPASAGDVRKTGADARRAQQLLGWSAQVQIAEGVRRQVLFETHATYDHWSSATHPG